MNKHICTMTLKEALSEAHKIDHKKIQQRYDDLLRTNKERQYKSEEEDNE